MKSILIIYCFKKNAINYARSGGGFTTSVEWFEGMRADVWIYAKAIDSANVEIW